jgi:EAL domain-containing protein (putative c-di-GMP-specific phosphodiesterase class I)
VAQRASIDSLLSNSGGMHLREKRQVFWDKVKIVRLLQTLTKKKNLKTNLFIHLSEASITDKMFIKWFLPGMRKIGVNASNLTFLLPSKVDEKNIQAVIKFAKKLRAFNSKIALDDLSNSVESLTLLKNIKPSYVRLSLPWLRQINGNEAKEFALAGFVRTLESRNISVIAPCGFSKNMRRLFVLSGASFCQERTLKSA